MADTKFKVGQKVRIKSTGAISRFAELNGARICTIKSVSEETASYGRGGGSASLEEETSPGGVWFCDLEHVTALQANISKFILQYELDTDPFEFFATEKEARKRIAELAERTDLKRESIRLIEIKKIRTVKLGVKISISK